MQHNLRLLKSDIDDLSPEMRLVVTQQVIDAIDAKPMDSRTHIERAELQPLKDLRDHYADNVARARQSHPWLNQGSTVRCPRCGHGVELPKP
jgi:hypothetical protein